jgi:hypothetical protein
MGIAIVGRSAQLAAAIPVAAVRDDGQAGQKGTDPEGFSLQTRSLLCGNHDDASSMQIGKR